MLFVRIRPACFCLFYALTSRWWEGAGPAFITRRNITGASADRRPRRRHSADRQ